MLHRFIHNELNPAPGTDSAGAPAAGTEESPTPTPTPAAEPSTPDRGQGPPDTIPYSRFKEVNDELAGLRDFRQFTELGYDPDSLGRLVGFEQAFEQDPLGTLGQVIDTVEVLPDNRKAALKELLAVQNPPETKPEGEDSSDADEPPVWAKPLIEDHQQRLAAEEMAANEANLDAIIAHWKKLDEEAGITTPDKAMLAHIGATASRTDLEITSLEQLAEAARADRLAVREHDLGGAVVRRGEGSPLAVPSGGAPAGQPVQLKNIKDATKAALADIESGRLGGAQ